MARPEFCRIRLPSLLYRSACVYSPTFLRLYAKYLLALGFTVPCGGKHGAYQRYTGDSAVPGKGEILVWQPHGVWSSGRCTGNGDGQRETTTMFQRNQAHQLPRRQIFFIHHSRSLIILTGRLSSCHVTMGRYTEANLPYFFLRRITCFNVSETLTQNSPLRQPNTFVPKIDFSESPQDAVMSSRRCLLALCLVAAIAACHRLVFSGSQKANDSALSGSRELDDHLIPDNVWFGDVWETKDFKWHFLIKNHGSCDVSISGFELSCSCLSTDPKSLVIPAREQKAVQVNLDLRNKGLLNSYKDFSVGITPRLTGNSSSTRRPPWKISGRVRKLLSVEPNLDFGSHSDLAQPLPAKSSYISASVPLSRLSAWCDSAFFNAVTKPVGTDGKTFELNVAPTCKLPVGKFSFAVHVSGIGLEPGESGDNQINVTGYVKADIQITPPKVLFGAKPVGSKCEDYLTAYSISRSSVRLLNVSANGDGLSACSIKAMGDTVIHVKQDIVGVGKCVNSIKSPCAIQLQCRDLYSCQDGK